MDRENEKWVHVELRAGDRVYLNPEHIMVVIQPTANDAKWCTVELSTGRAVDIAMTADEMVRRIEEIAANRKS